MLQDHVVALVSEDALWNILPAIRRNGLGHLARVIRPTRRGPASAQLQRAGVPTASIPSEVDEATIVLLVSAAKRSPMTAALTIGNGARMAWIVSISGTWSAIDDAVIPISPVPTLPQVAIEVPGRHAAVLSDQVGESTNPIS